MRFRLVCIPFVLLAVFAACPAFAAEGHVDAEDIYQVGQLIPTDSTLKVSEGDPMPDFSLPSINGQTLSLAYFKGHNLVLSFIPAAWTPVCSDQWPGYNIMQEIFEQYDARLLGVSVDNVPTLYAWTREMGGLWFPVASDFFPHGQLAETLGILRSDGMAERALIAVDKDGIIRFIEVHDINSRPDLANLLDALKAMQ